MKRRQFIATASLAFAGFPASASEDEITAQLYSSINDLREYYDRDTLEVDTELESDAYIRADEGLNPEDDRVTEITTDMDVDIEMFCGMTVMSWLLDDTLHNVVLNTEIESFGIGIVKHTETINIALDVE